MTEQTQAQVLVVDAGGQYCHLIARRVRDAGVQAIISSPLGALEHLRGLRGIIISGGPSSVYSPDAPVFPKELFEAGIPILGICYGHQVLASIMGADVKPGRHHEYGQTVVEIIQQDSIFKGLSSRIDVWMSHGDEVVSPPLGFQVLGRSPTCPVAAMANLDKKLFSVQFHPEVTDTPAGPQILSNFLFNVCECEKNWNTEAIVARLKRELRDRVSEKHVLFFVSGGVDSTVAFTLCASALDPSNVTGVFVDTGFMRKKERDEIESVFAARGWSNIRFLDRSENFFRALRGIADPEKKRHVIGECFLDVQREVEAELGLGATRWLLGQGTIYPDTIESGGDHGKKAAIIKTHHNRVPAIEEMIKKGLILEPLKEFYKDEVRSLGRQLGLPESIVAKNPFPGPGLAVRCLCSEKAHEIAKVGELSTIANRYELDAWSAPLRTVGVQGDYRSYTNLVILTGEKGLDTFAAAAREITREIRGTNRVAALLWSHSASIELAHVHPKRFLTRKRVDLLREADFVVNELLSREGLAAEVWQFPVVMLPLGFEHGETIALRPVLSSDAMTARHAQLPATFLLQVVKELRTMVGIDMILYDVTDKPPATIEWE